MHSLNFIILHWRPPFWNFSVYQSPSDGENIVPNPPLHKPQEYQDCVDLVLTEEEFEPFQILGGWGWGGSGGGGGERTQQSFIQGGSAPRSKPLPFYTPFLIEKAPLSCTFHCKLYPFHKPLRGDFCETLYLSLDESAVRCIFTGYIWKSLLVTKC